MRTVFFGTPEWAVPSLRTLLASGHEVAAVVTNPDRPAGRKLEPRPSPVKNFALEAGLEVLQPAKARDPGFIEAIRKLRPQVAAVVAYGKILPLGLLEIPPLGFLNVHFSLLPAYRGAAPVQRALMDGVSETGVTIIVLTEGMDEGPILAKRSVRVGAMEGAGELGSRLADLGADLLVEAIGPYATGDMHPAEQEHGAATYAPKIDPAETRIDWSRPADSVGNLARALDPDPGAWTVFRARRMKVFKAAPAEDAPVLEPGEPEVGRGKLVVGTGSQPVEIVELQPAGKRRMRGEDFARGLRPAPGERFE